MCCEKCGQLLCVLCAVCCVPVTPSLVNVIGYHLHAQTHRSRVTCVRILPAPPPVRERLAYTSWPRAHSLGHVWLASASVVDSGGEPFATSTSLIPPARHDGCLAVCAPQASVHSAVRGTLVSNSSLQVRQRWAQGAVRDHCCRCDVLWRQALAAAPSHAVPIPCHQVRCTPLLLVRSVLPWGGGGEACGQRPRPWPGNCGLLCLYL